MLDPQGLPAEDDRCAALRFPTGNKFLSGEPRAKPLGWLHSGGFARTISA